MTKIEGLKIGDIFQYTKQADGWYNGAAKVTGLIAKLCDYSLAEIKNDFGSIINDFTLGDVITVQNGTLLALLKDVQIGNLSASIQALTIGEIMGYKKDATHGWYRDANANGAYNDGEAVTDDIVKILADYKVSDLNAGFSDRLLAEMKSSVKLSKFMAYDSCSIFKLFSEAEYNELTIDTLPTALSSKLNKDITLGALVDVGMITTSGTDAMLTTERQATIEMLINGTKPATDPTYRSWRTVTISEFFSLAFKALDPLSQIPGVTP
jgi:hypothetical protein